MKSYSYVSFIKIEPCLKPDFLPTSVTRNCVGRKMKLRNIYINVAHMLPAWRYEQLFVYKGPLGFHTTLTVPYYTLITTFHRILANLELTLLRHRS